MIIWPAKAPGEVEDFAFDFTEALESGETIATKNVTASGVTVDSSAISGTKVQAWLSGGVVGGPGLVNVSITTSGGRTYNETALVPIGEEPVSLAEAKVYLRVLSVDEDSKVATMIPRARAWVEDYTGLALIRRQFTEQHLPRHGAIRLYRGPLVSVDSVVYTDAAGDQTYIPRAWPPETTIFPTANDSWPLLSDDNRFTVTYTAGFAVEEIDDRLIGAMYALIEGEYSEGYAYPDRSVAAAEQCCGYLRQEVL